MSAMKILNVILVILQLFVIKIVILPAQKVSDVADAKTTFELLLTRYKIYLEYYSINDETRQLYEEALQYGQNEEYEIGSILLEEAIEVLKNEAETSSGVIKPISFSTTSLPKSTVQDFKFSMISGMDFNRQEFELGFVESDSTVEEEFSKPYVGLRVRYSMNNGEHNVLEVQNSLRFDKENLRDDYRIRWQPISDFYILYSGYWNEARVENTFSYWDQMIASRLTFDLARTVYFSFLNTFNYKSYRTDSFYLKDYYRNRFNALGELRTTALGIFSFEYWNELNESLGLQDNDYTQNNIRLGIRNDSFEKFYYNLLVDGGIRDYVIQFDDSLIFNRFQALGIEAIYEVGITQNVRLFVENNFLYKYYQQKSSLEPDYYWNFLRPGIRITLFDQVDVGVGYEWEFKEHKAQPLDSYDVNEQNYNSQGLFVSFNYFSLSGTYFTASVSYQWRRYPDSITNDLISIYSNRNIFSAMLLAYVPLSKNFTFNVFATFDNDKDIDFDQQNNQSTIFTLELEYTF
jgi:hypothetical protein